MELLLIRHAQPAWVVGGRGRRDPSLTDLGRHQAKRLAARLAGAGVTHLVTSDATRSIETAEPIASVTGLEPQVIPDLTEMRMPDFDGTPTETVENFFHDLYRRPPEEWWEGIPGGETFKSFHERVTSAVTDLLGDLSVTPHGGHLDAHLWDVAESDETVVVVGHGGTNALAIGFLLGLTPTPWEWERFALGHASVTRLITFPLGGAHIFSMRACNDREHLVPDERTT